MVTIKDVAKWAGVSKTTVSYVLSGNPRISQATARRVLDAVDELGYTVNHAARALSTTHTMTIAVVSRADHGAYLSMSAGLHMYALSKYAAEYGYELLFVNARDDVAALRNVAASKRADGVVIMDVRRDDPRIAVAVEEGIPTVLFGYADQPMGLDMVDSDYAAEACRIVDDFAASGCREAILFLQSEREFSRGIGFAWRFRDAFAARARERGVTVHEVVPRDDDSAPAPVMRAALAEHPQATAMALHNEAAAMMASQVLSDMGMRVPEDLRVVALLPRHMAMMLQVPFALVEADVDLLARRVIDVLVARIRGSEEPTVRALVDFPLTESWAA